MKKHSLKIFSKTQTYHPQDWTTPHEQKNAESRQKFLNERIEILFGLFDEYEKFVGWTCAFQMRANEIYMMNSAVFPKYRRKGWYTKLTQAVVKEADRLGFQAVTSYHLTTNNAVLIAKMRLGFKITGMEVSDEVGTLVKLAYFVNPTRAEMMAYRSGEIYPSPRVKKVLRLK